MTAIEELRHYTETLRQPLRGICDHVLYHPLFAKIHGSGGEHHCYPGGLAVHTLEVTRYACDMAEMFPEADKEAVIVAAVFHDFMKIHEYQVPEVGVNIDAPTCAGVEIVIKPHNVIKTPYRKLVRHVAGSHAEFVRLTTGIPEENLPTEQRIKIEHAILAHHGRYEWGSPVEPQLVEAYCLHFADMLSVKFGPNTKCLQH